MIIKFDPKMLELSVYEGSPHLLVPVVTDMKQAANALRWGVAEMERRYQLMAALGVRNLAGYNRRVKDARERAADARSDSAAPAAGEKDLLDPRPARCRTARRCRSSSSSSTSSPT